MLLPFSESEHISEVNEVLKNKADMYDLRFERHKEISLHLAKELLNELRAYFIL